MKKKTKFSWFYPVKSKSAKEVIDKLELQQTIFGNPTRIITDKGKAFTESEFKEYCAKEGIEPLKITTGMPRGNEQLERIGEMGAHVNIVIFNSYYKSFYLKKITKDGNTSRHVVKIF